MNVKITPIIFDKEVFEFLIFAKMLAYGVPKNILTKQEYKNETNK